MRAGWRGVRRNLLPPGDRTKGNRGPPGRRPVGRRTHFEGMKATIDLVALYLELD